MERPGRDECKAETPHRCSFSSKNSVRSRVPAGFLTDGSLRGGVIPSAFASPAPSRNAIRWLVAGGAPQSQWRVRGRFSRPSLFPTSADVGTRARMWVFINTQGTPGSMASERSEARAARRPAESRRGFGCCRRGPRRCAVVAASNPSSGAIAKVIRSRPWTGASNESGGLLQRVRRSRYLESEGSRLRFLRCRSCVDFPAARSSENAGLSA